MADIYFAYSFLNEALDLKLSPVQIDRAEAEFKKLYAKHNKIDINRPEDWEFFAHLKPRKEGAPVDLKTVPRLGASILGAAAVTRARRSDDEG